MKIAQTLFPISTVIRVESNRSIRETINLALRSFSLAKALYLYLLTQAKAVSAPEKNAVKSTATTRRMILSHKGMSNSDFPPNNHTYKKPLFLEKGAFIWVLIFVRIVTFVRIDEFISPIVWDNRSLIEIRFIEDIGDELFGSA